MANDTSKALVIAYLWDRVAQYDESSGYHAFVGDLVRGIATGEPEKARQHGELDDLLARARRYAKSHADGAA